MKLLLVDDDEAFVLVLRNALGKRGFKVAVANGINDVTSIADLQEFQYAIVDLKLGSESGLQAIEYLLQKNKEIKIVMLTAYASIATAVEAIKLGAKNYITKPATIQEIIEKLTQEHNNAKMQIKDTTLSVKRLEWEHLQKVLLEHGGNISAAARALNMHRRTLQRKLQKYPVKQ